MNYSRSDRAGKEGMLPDCFEHLDAEAKGHDIRVKSPVNVAGVKE
jgi:hypothetical protein